MQGPGGTRQLPLPPPCLSPFRSPYEKKEIKKQAKTEGIVGIVVEWPSVRQTRGNSRRCTVLLTFAKRDQPPSQQEIAYCANTVGLRKEKMNK